MLLFVWIAFAVITALAAQARGRSVWGWLVIGALTGVFGLIAVLVMQRGQPATPAPPPPGFAPMRRREPFDAPRPVSLGVPGGVLEVYKGVSLRRTPAGEVGAFGRVFQSVEQARGYIDSRDPSPELKIGQFVETYRSLDISVGPNGYRAGGLDFPTIADARQHAERITRS